MMTFLLVALVGGIVSLLFVVIGAYSVGECSIRGYCTTKRVILSVIAGIVGAVLFLLFAVPML
jgi:hypothetical protein